jgi:hypothetical protein
MLNIVVFHLINAFFKITLIIITKRLPVHNFLTATLLEMFSLLQSDLDPVKHPGTGTGTDTGFAITDGTDIAKFKIFPFPTDEPN